MSQHLLRQQNTLYFQKACDTPTLKNKHRIFKNYSDIQAHI